VSSEEAMPSAQFRVRSLLVGKLECSTASGFVKVVGVKVVVTRRVPQPECPTAADQPSRRHTACGLL